MAWVVDTCLLIDVLDHDPEFGERSARLLDRKAAEGLVICPVTYVELSPAFLGDVARQGEFLDGVGVRFHVDWTWDDLLEAHRSWNRHIGRRRSAGTKRRPIADVFIGAFATRHDGILTRNVADFRQLFPSLEILAP